MKKTVFLLLVTLSFRSGAQQPKLILPVGHTLAVNCAYFSPDGKYILTASKDKTAKVWSAESGKLLADLKGHTKNINSASFSPDGKYIVTASDDNTARIWDAANGKLLSDLKGHSDAVKSASFSPDGKYVVTASWDETAKIWNAVNGELLLDFNGHSDAVNGASFSPDGKYIVTVSDDNTAKVWDATNGKLLSNEHFDGVNSASFSPDGKHIVITSGDGTARVYNALSAEILLDLNKHTEWINSVSYSPDGKYIVTASWDKTAKIWNATNGELLADLKGHTKRVYSAFFSPDGKYIVTTSWDKTAKIWNAASGKLVADLKGHTHHVNTASFSPDGNYIVTASSDNTAKVWNAKSGKWVADLKGLTQYVNSASFSPGGKYIVTASDDNTAKIWNTTNGKLVSDLKGHSDVVNSAAYSPDGKYIVTASDDSTAKVWNAANGELIEDLKGHTDCVYSASYSPDGKYIVTTAADANAKVWNATNGKLVSSLKGPIMSVINASFSPDSRYIIMASFVDNILKVWNAANGEIVSTINMPKALVYSVSYSPDGKYILTASDDNTAKIWNAASGELVSDLNGHTDVVNYASFSPDGKFVITASYDNTIKLWSVLNGQVMKTIKVSGGGHVHEIDLMNKRILCLNNSGISIHDFETGKKFYTFFHLNNTDYLIYDNDEHYDGTDAARNLLYFTCGTEIIELNQVKDQLWVPNLAERIMKGDSINAPKLSDLNICGLTPQVEELNDQKDAFHFRILPRRGGLGETVVYVNGIEARRYKPAELRSNSGSFELLVKKSELQNLLVAGKENPVTVKAYTADNTISSRGAIVTIDRSAEKSAAPDLYAVMVGVSDYKGNELDLKYAAKDATDISATIGISARKLLNTDGKEHVFTYNLTTADNHYQFPEKKAIQQTLAEIGKKAKANDILLIFFAGHGVLSGEADKKHFYFLTADASTFSNPEMIRDAGISMEELTGWISPQQLKAQKRVLIFDACNSGQGINDFVKMGKEEQGYLAARNDDKAQQIKAIDKLNEKSGLFILSASASNQSAYEMGRYSQGLLTYSLLKAVKQQPDILEEGKYLNLGRWFTEAGKTVSEISRESGARQEPQIVSFTNFNIGIVDEEVMAKIVLPEEKPLFAASNFQNSDETADGDNLELSKAINLQLNELATRGAESKIVYVMATNSPDAWTLSGRYDVKGRNITVRVSMKKNNITQYRFEETGTTDKIKELASSITGKAAGMVK